MAHFAFTRAAGVWIAGTVVTAAEAADLDGKTYKAINGDDGGDWSPAAIISLAGAGLRCYGATFKLYDVNPTLVLEFDEAVGTVAMQTGLLWVSSSATFQVEGPFNIIAGSVCNDDGARDCSGNWVLSGGAWSANGGHTLTVAAGAGTWTWNNVVSFTGAFGFTGNGDFSGDVSMGNAAGDTFLVNATTTHTAPVTFGDDVSITDPVTFSSDGRIRTRVTTGADADTTYNVTQYDEVHVINGALSATRIYTIADGAAGEHIRIMNHDIAQKITLKRADASTICELRSGFATLYGWVDLVWITRWEISAFYYHQ